MANAYAQAGDVVARLPSADDVSVVDEVLIAMSRWIDGYCHRRFWLDPTVTARLYAACNPYILDVEEIGLAAGVVVATDDGTGTFATTLTATDYQLEPVNAVFATGGARPFTRLRALSTTWPRAVGVGNVRPERVRVTARYGWPAVPPVVKEACITLTVDHFENPSAVRSESIDGYSVSYGAVAAAQNMLAGQFRKPLVA